MIPVSVHDQNIENGDEEMAKRPIFIANSHSPFFTEVQTDFQYYPGFSLSQYQKSIQSLHNEFISINPMYRGKVLEISTKSPSFLGAQLSAFNLKYRCKDGICRPLEVVFQASKLFENGLQFFDLLDKSPVDAKHDPRLRNSGRIVGFQLDDNIFPTVPTTFFYEWLYANAICSCNNILEAVSSFSAFSDIAFNPQRSINCQARSAAIVVGLVYADKLDEAISSPEAFNRIVYITSVRTEQLSLL